ncbi:virginiamycin A acetyltransferase [Nocardiopsis mwathae]|uniref:Virginiamycin A acetyltransferase n=1 Tax=Nocardiopsis mwathae TaxID=1472723 RepID=A0A7W9YI99_9ACTN|nr:CatB-related O-acetyltransferase [Nocardiopsis mwathae]MBB6171991.1 virginiamycin A acetyltransferase [Nocardiopsis mwathae]
MTAPNPADPFPLAEGERRCVFIRPTVTSDLLDVGEYTYYDASEDPGTFEEDRMLYAFGSARLVIGRFCAIAAGSRFLLYADHMSSGPSAFPFTMFSGAWQDATVDTFLANHPSKGDTVVGNDVWIGRDAMVMPGVTIGDGAIVAAGAVVSRDVEPYTVVGGSPARVVKRRYSERDAARLVEAAWWNWPIETVTEHAATLMNGTVDQITAIADRLRAEKDMGLESTSAR